MQEEEIPAKSMGRIATHDGNAIFARRVVYGPIMASEGSVGVVNLVLFRHK